MTRASLRLYLPLLGFVVPTLAIGYGIVIPRSCIAGVNALTIGFGTTVLGAVMTYIAGVRLAAPTCSRFTLRQRLERAINRQASRPHGFFGRLLGVIWRFEHRDVNRTTIELLDPCPKHDVLEVGSGPGVALREVAARVPLGLVVGIDVSEVMVDAARRLNAKAVREGRVNVLHTDGEDLGLTDASFDRIFSVHCLYFWRDPSKVLVQLARSLRLGGRLVVAFRTNVALPARFKDEIYRFYSATELVDMLRQSGFDHVRVVDRGAADHVAWIVAERVFRLDETPDVRLR